MLSIRKEEFKNPGWENLLETLLSHFGEEEGFLILDSSRSAQQKEFSSEHSSFVFLEPLVRASSTNDQSTLKLPDGTTRTYPDIWTVYETVLSVLTDSEHGLEPTPFIGGYFGYEMLHGLESIPKTSDNAYRLPLSVFYVYKTVLEVPLNTDSPITVHTITLENFESPFWKASDLECLIQGKTARAPQSTPSETHDKEILPALLESFSNFSKARYLEAVQTIRELIHAGEVYQVNLSQQFRIPGNNGGASLYRKLRHLSPADFSAFFHGESEHGAFSICSSSPERFFRARSGALLCSPIKGTRPRGTTLEEDQRIATELASSKKDLAELSMIVDLERNDLGRISKPGSVVVSEHARLETYAQVHHLVSDIRGQLRSDIGIFDAVKRIFPCGSVTGCPKIAAMTIISSLEKTARSVYTGSIGWFGTNNSCELNVAIRTAVQTPKEVIFQGGGAVVIDSDPESEYEETLAKVRGLHLACNFEKGKESSYDSRVPL